MTEETKLLPCPFCGGKAERIEIEEGDEVVVNIGGSIIECTQCHVSSPVHFERKENLVSSWNTRALSPPEPTEGLRIQGIMERHAPDGFDPASDDMTIPFAIKIGELEEQLTALRTLPLQERGWPDQEYQAVVTKAEQLRAALKLIVEQVEDYERVNNLAPNPGRQHCWDSVAHARVILAEDGTK